MLTFELNCDRRPSVYVSEIKQALASSVALPEEERNAAAYS